MAHTYRRSQPESEVVKGVQPIEVWFDWRKIPIYQCQDCGGYFNQKFTAEQIEKVSDVQRAKLNICRCQH
jgi:hypothetical protein